jgi:transmembrane sensor
LPRRPPRMVRTRSGLAIAAVVASVALLGASFAAIRLLGGSDQVAVQRLVTEKGERARIELSDGTEVLLGPGNRIDLAADFGAHSREVGLSGEAFFDVVPDPSRPFLVHVRGAVTRVLGTEFGVRAYPDDPVVRVAVAEGTVSLRSTEERDSAAAIVRAGELGEIPSHRGPVVTRPADLDVHLGWRHGRLTFDNTPLDEVAKEIERWFGVPVRVGDPSLSTRRLTASFRDQPVERILEVVALSLELDWTRIGEAYVFVPRRSASLVIG